MRSWSSAGEIAVLLGAEERRRAQEEEEKEADFTEEI